MDQPHVSLVLFNFYFELCFFLSIMQRRGTVRFVALLSFFISENDERSGIEPVVRHDGKRRRVLNTNAIKTKTISQLLYNTLEIVLCT